MYAARTPGASLESQEAKPGHGLGLVYRLCFTTVRKRATPNAFLGPAAIVTAPVEIAGASVGLLFRAVTVVFPPRATDPRVLVRAPDHAAAIAAVSP